MSSASVKPWVMYLVTLSKDIPSARGPIMVSFPTGSFPIFFRDGFVALFEHLEDFVCDVFMH